MSTKSNDLAIVPVVLMIAMSPSMLNAKTPVHIMPMGEENIPELIAQPNEEVNDATYVAKPEQFQQDYPLGVAYLSKMKIQQIKQATVNGSKASIVLATHTSDKYENGVEEIYLIKNSYTNNNVDQMPPRIKELIYHNIGAEEFLGIKVYEYIYKPGKYSPVGFMTREYRLDDETAQYLLDFNAKSANWLDKTSIVFRETTSPKLQPVKSYNY